MKRKIRCLVSSGVVVLAASQGGLRADSVTLSPVADTFINSALPDNNAGGDTAFDAGTDGGNLGVPGVRRGLLRFDLSSLPPGATVTSVVLQLRVTRVPGIGPVNSTFDLHRLTAAWGEGTKVGNNGAPATAGEATWNSRQHGSAGWTSPGALDDVLPAASASTAVGSSLGATHSWTGAGLASDVQFWLANPAQNYGWLLRSQDEASARTVRGFGSRESGNAPSLQVGYTPPPAVIDDPIVERIPKGDIVIELQTVADGLASPVGMAVPDDNSGRMFVYDQDGRVWVVTAGGRLPTPLLDLNGRLVLLGAYDERGLLGLAVHPNFAQNPYLYTYTSEPYGGPADFQNGLGATNNHQSVIAEWRISAGNSNVVDVSSRREIMRLDQPQSNHNGGAMHFGPDGYLYITLGDGGQANDVGAGHVPGGNAQELGVIHGKLIRIDVAGSNSANGQYGIPASNPFVGTNGLDEIYAYGLRNPFTFSFDRNTGDLYLTDVGQRKVEEVNRITAGGNYGWNLREGSFWFDPATGNLVTAPVRTPPPDLIDPIAQYDHDDGAAAIGGYVYRGSAIPALAGRFVFGDWGSFAAPSGRLFYLDATNGVKELIIGAEDRPLGLWLKGFGQGPDGELYVLGNRWLGPSGKTGRVMKIVPLASPVAMTAVAVSGTNVAASWSGGAGPFAVQRKASLDEPVWANAGVTNLRSAVVAQDRSSGFFRVRDAGPQRAVPLSAALSGASEVPATPSPGTGLGLFVLEGNTLSFNLRYTGLLSEANAAHVHGPAGASGNASVLVNLAPYNGGAWGTNGTLSGVVVLTDAQKALVLAGKTYVNIHTPGYPGGEIRGQIAPVNFQAILSAAYENSPVTSSGTGLANLALVGNQLTFNVTYGGLTAAANAAHIHGPAGPRGDAGVLINLAPFNGGGFGAAGSLSGTVTLNAAQLAAVIDGLTYINFHTPNHPGGEIRGQILPHPTGVPLTVLLSGLAERPVALTNAASGEGTMSLEGNLLTFNIAYRGLSGAATAAHIHGMTNTTQSAGVLVNLAPFNGGSFGVAGTLSGSVALTAEQREAVLRGLTYVNLHTASNPGGEIRGQIAPVAMSAGLSGYNERPSPAATSGSGFATLALVRDQLTLALTYENLLSPATMAHIHGPAGFTGSAGVLVDLAPLNGGAFGTAGSLSGTVTLPVPTLLNVIDTQTYINLHTTNYPGGEIRGHLMR